MGVEQILLGALRLVDAINDVSNRKVCRMQCVRRGLIFVCACIIFPSGSVRPVHDPFVKGLRVGEVLS